MTGSRSHSTLGAEARLHSRPLASWSSFLLLHLEPLSPTHPIHCRGPQLWIPPALWAAGPLKAGKGGGQSIPEVQRQGWVARGRVLGGRSAGWWHIPQPLQTPAWWSVALVRVPGLTCPALRSGCQCPLDQSPENEADGKDGRKGWGRGRAGGGGQMKTPRARSWDEMGGWEWWGVHEGGKGNGEKRVGWREGEREPEKQSINDNREDTGLEKCLQNWPRCVCLARLCLLRWLWGWAEEGGFGSWCCCSLASRDSLGQPSRFAEGRH